MEKMLVTPWNWEALGIEPNAGVEPVNIVSMISIAD
jgi:hypothetical protein